MNVELLTFMADGPLRGSGGSPSLTSWALTPQIVVTLLLLGGVYAAGWGRLRSRARASLLPSWRAWCFAAGLIIAWVALLSPIGRLADYFLFAHMIEHMLLIMFVPPLIWLGAPLLVMLWAFPYNVRRMLGRTVAKGTGLRRAIELLTQPGVAAFIYLGTFAVWHFPRLYDLAQGTSLTHQLEHLCFVGTGLLYWWPVVHPAGGKRRLGYGQTFVYLAPTYVEQTVLGALLTFAPLPLYAYYASGVSLWNLSPHSDQQIAGVIMWVAGGIILTIQAAIVFLVWFHGQDKQEQRELRERSARIAARAARMQGGE